MSFNYNAVHKYACDKVFNSKAWHNYTYYKQFYSNT